MILKKMTFKKTASRFFAILVCVALTGCQLFKDPAKEGEPEFNLRTLDLILDTDANYNSALAIDLVVSYQPEILKALMKMNAADYFMMADQIRRDYPEVIRVWHWELTPGQAVSNYTINACREGFEPFGAIVFARYLTPGSHRIRVGSSKEIHVLMKREDLCIIEQGCPGGALVLPSAANNAVDVKTAKIPKQLVNAEKEVEKGIEKEIKKALM